MAGVTRAAVPAALNVQSTTLVTATSTASTSFVDLTGLSVSITPSAATSKVLVLLNITAGSASDQSIYFNLVRGSTNLAQPASTGYQASLVQSHDGGVTYGEVDSLGMTYLDSPASTSALTYKVQFKAAAGTAYVNRRVDAPGLIGTSTITVMEIKQ